MTSPGPPAGAPTRTSALARAGLALVLLLLLASDGLAQRQDDLRIRRPVTPILGEVDVEPPATRVAFDPSSGAWVAVSGDAWTSSSSPSIPAEMRDKLEAFLAQGKRIDAIEFTPTGGWAIVAGNLNWTRNVGGDYFDELGRLIGEGRRIRAVAFDPDDWRRDRGFVIVHDRGVVARSVPEEMRSKLDEYRRRGYAIRAVEFTPNGGWTIVADEAHFTRNVGGTDATAAEAVRPADLLLAAGRGTPAQPRSYYERLRSVADRDGFRPVAVAFDPERYDERKGYLLVADGAYWAQDVDPRLANWLESEAGLDGTYVRTTGAERDRATAEPAPEASRASAPRKSAVIDLQRILIRETDEGPGDEPYVVVYPLRGRLGAGDRVHTFDPDAQILTIRGGSNWGDEGYHDLPATGGRIAFEDLDPFEVYGVVIVVGERDPGTSVGEREGAFYRGEFADDRGVWEVVVDRFDRALPFDAPAPDYRDTSASNVREVVERLFDGIDRYFGDSFDREIASTLETHMKRGNGDDLFGIVKLFWVNAPGLTDDEVAGIAGEHAHRPGGIFRNVKGPRPGVGVFLGKAPSYEIDGEHRAHVVVGDS